MSRLEGRDRFFGLFLEVIIRQSGRAGREESSFTWGELRYNEKISTRSAQQMTRIILTFLNAASRERFPLGVPHESQRYMHTGNFDYGRPLTTLERMPLEGKERE